jgi:hypothetical protein
MYKAFDFLHERYLIIAGLLHIFLVRLYELLAIYIQGFRVISFL